jgi:hypothetical protein
MLYYILYNYNLTIYNFKSFFFYKGLQNKMLCELEYTHKNKPYFGNQLLKISRVGLFK